MGDATRTPPKPHETGDLGETQEETRPDPQRLVSLGPGDWRAKSDRHYLYAYDADGDATGPPHRRRPVATDSRGTASPAAVRDKQGDRAVNSNAAIGEDSPLALAQLPFADGQEDYDQDHAQDHSAPSEGETAPERTFNVFVGDLSAQATETDLEQAFFPTGSFHSAHVFRDPRTRQSRGFGFVHFRTREGQRLALEDERYSKCLVAGKTCSVMPSKEKDTVFVGNVPVQYTEQRIVAAINELVGGGAVDCELQYDEEGNSTGLALVKFVVRDDVLASLCFVLGAILQDIVCCFYPHTFSRRAIAAQTPLARSCQRR
jgi:RNA recognition motif